MSDAWSRYWARETSGACLPGAPPAVQAVLREKWTGLARALADGDHVLDICSGAGAVLRVLGADRPRLVLQGIDQAEVGAKAAALGVLGGIDAACLPFADARFAVVTSQFGLEYCGPAAWAEAARVLAPGGRLVLICHHRQSRAVQHNGRRLAAMRAMADAGLFRLAAAAAAAQAEDHVATAAVRAAIVAHAEQSVVAELPAALGHWLRAGRPDAVEAIRLEAEAEMARLAAMQAAALDAADVAERLGWLAPLQATGDVLMAEGDAVAWTIAA